MPTYSATRELIGSPETVWAFLAEPTNLAGWWPGIGEVEPDRRGLAPGARWRIQTRGRANVFIGRKPDVTGYLVFLEVRRPELATWQFVEGKVDVELRLAEVSAGRTRVELTVSAPFLGGLGRSLPQRALSRLQTLCRTGGQV
ncbi:MAG TPA: SRPBCC family protein [Gaiellaceae bacterium]